LAFLDDDDEDAGDDIFAADVKKSGRRKDDDYVEVDSDVEMMPQPKKVMTKGKSTPGRKSEDVEGYQ
jgi:replication factor C subunit 1